MKNVRNDAVSILTLIGLFLSALARGGDVEQAFPSRVSELVSPDKAAKIVNHDPDNNNQMHTLELIYPGHPDTVMHRYGRHVLVAWAQDSQHIFVTDYAGSSDSTCYLYSVKLGKLVDLRSREEEADSKAIKVLQQKHANLECISWKSPTELLVKAYGWLDAHSADREAMLVFNIDNGYRLRK